jgi:hypothetical protein
LVNAPRAGRFFSASVARLLKISPNLLLTTAIEVNQRPMDDLAAVPLRKLAQYWPAELRARLDALGATTVGEVLALSPLDVITAPGSSRDVFWSIVKEINDWVEWVERYAGVTRGDVERFCNRPGFTRPPAPAASAPARTWGCLWAWREAPKEVVFVSSWGQRDVSTTLEQMYLGRGLSVSHAPPEGFELAPEGVDAAPLVRGPGGPEALADDALLVCWSGLSNWYSVQSRQWGLAMPGENQLALALSAHLPVLAIAGVAGRYTELSVYRKGALVRTNLGGAEPPAETHAGAAPLTADDLHWLCSFCGDDYPVSPAFLASRLGDAEALASAIGLETQGYEEAMRQRVGAPAPGVSLAERIAQQTAYAEHQFLWTARRPAPSGG